MNLIKVTSLLILFFIAGCSTLGVGKAITSAFIPDTTSNDVNVEAQVGKENNKTEQIVGQQTQTTNTVGGDQTTVSVMNQNIPMWYILLLILGWMLPSPHEIWKGIVNLFKRK